MEDVNEGLKTATVSSWTIRKRGVLGDGLQMSWEINYYQHSTNKVLSKIQLKIQSFCPTIAIKLLHFNCPNFKIISTVKLLKWPISYLFTP